MNSPRRVVQQYGMLLVLLLLAAFFSVATIRPQQAGGTTAASSLARRLAGPEGAGREIVIAGRGSEDDLRFAASLAERLRGRGVRVAAVVNGGPAEVRAALEPLAAPSRHLVVATTASFAPVVTGILESVPALSGVPVVTPAPYRWPTFLLADNLLNVANQIAVIAIVAVGMTMVIITGGIDLSVGSVIALSAVTIAWIVGRLGAESAGLAGVLVAGAGTLLLCAAAGLFSGAMVTRFRVPPFIATLGVMQVASGVAYIVSEGRPIYRLPERFVLLGRGAEPLLGIPYAVLLMLALYLAAHVLMSRTTLGRYIYAVGGNAEAARLAGVRVGGVLLFVYAVTGALAGLGGIVMASQLRSGAPTYGVMYELYVIAAVVVGGTSLSGGEGRIFGTLIGAFIIAVIQNGMNLTNVESYTQKVVLGLVILGAVLLDRLRRR